MYRAALVVMLGLLFVVVAAPSAYAGEPSPPKNDGICHNIGGPKDLGANCDMTGNCTYTTGDGVAITVVPPQFLGIIIGFNQDSNALAAHLAHGDGPILTIFDPPLHLASVDGPHRDSNVECLGTRLITAQPPEPGN